MLSIEDYEITKDGKVINRKTGYVRKPQHNHKGYQVLMIGGKGYLISRLVAEKYVPNPDNKPQVNHIDGDKDNNCYTNLEWVTNQENRSHAVKNNLHKSGENCSFSKLNWEKVNFIREHKELNSHQLAKMFGVSPSHVRGIRQNRWWKVDEKIC